MIFFWTLAAAMILLGIVWIIPPLVGPKHPSISQREQQNIEIARERLKVLEDEFESGAVDQEQFDHSRLEIEQILANDLGPDSDNTLANSTAQYGLKTALVVSLSLPLLSILMYGLLGNSKGLSVEPGLAATSSEHPGNADRTPSVDELVNRLEERLKEDPNNPDGWRLLARSYSVMERYPEAIEALRRVRGLVGDDPNLLIELADMMATAQDGSFAGQPAELLAKVLEMFPQHPGGLWLAGRSAVMARDFPLALKYWRQLEALLSKQGKGVETVRIAIAHVEQAMGQQVVASTAENSVESPELETAGTTGPEIKINVAFDQSLSNSVDPNDTVFIYAQALSGPPMPLAVTRKKVRDLPLQVTLNDSMAMMPAMALSKFSEVRVIARVSKTGNAFPQSGDFKGQVEPVSVTESGPVEILIAEKIP
ncbi:MAG: c-type cytochrome biogenesis protein CcmI [Methylococcaceae bacterium]|nr:c-type cytochrome biogenesis protein CcmI [Methylococcaceae bacterium]